MKIRKDTAIISHLQIMWPGSDMACAMVPLSLQQIQRSVAVSCSEAFNVHLDLHHKYH